MLVLSATLLPVGGALAQAVPVPQEAPRTIPGLVIATPSPTPAPTRTPVPIPTGPVLGLPAAIATPHATEPPRAVPARATKATRPEEAGPPAPTAIPTPSDRPAPGTSPTDVAIPAPTPAVAPSATPSIAATPVPIGEGHADWPWLAIGAGLIVALALAAGALFRRRASASAEGKPIEAMPVVAPPPPLPVPTGPRARIDVALRPLRAGLNMLSAVVEAEVVVTNTGDVPAAQVRISATLLSAHAGQEADLAATFAAPPPGRPAAPPFALAAGEERRVRVVAALSRDAVRSMEAGGRPMFVPLVAIDVRYAADADGLPGRTGQAFVIGVERVDSAKLAPFWLDGPLRMYDQIAARAQGQPQIS